MGNLQDRFKQAVGRWEKKHNKKFVQAELVRYTGATRATVSLWFTGSTQSISTYEYLVKAAEYFEVSIDWLSSGKGPMERRTKPLRDVVDGYEVNRKSDTIQIHQYHDVAGAMGPGIILKDQPGQITGWTVTPEWINKNIPANTGKNNLRIVTGFGDSMKGMYNPGDPLIVDIGVKICDHDGVYFFRVGEEGFIKRLQRVPGEGIRVLSVNKEYPMWLIKPDMDFEVLAKVLTAWKSDHF